MIVFLKEKEISNLRKDIFRQDLNLGFPSPVVAGNLSSYSNIYGLNYNWGNLSLPFSPQSEPLLVPENLEFPNSAETDQPQALNTIDSDDTIESLIEEKPSQSTKPKSKPSKVKTKHQK